MRLAISWALRALTSRSAVAQNRDPIGDEAVARFMSANPPGVPNGPRSIISITSANSILASND